MSNLKAKVIELVTPLATRIAALDEKIEAAGIEFSNAVTAYEFAALLATENPTEKNRADVDAAAAVREENRRELDKLQAARRQLVTVGAQLEREAAERDLDRKRRAIASAGCHKFAVRLDEMLASMREAAIHLHECEQQAISAGGDLVGHFKNANLHLSWMVNDALAVHGSFGFKKLISSPNKKFADFFTTDALLEAAKLK